MATYTDTIGFNRGSAAHRAQGVPKTSVLEVDLDFAAITAARVAAGATALAAADVLEALPIPAKTFILAAGIDVTTADGTANTLHLGDGADPNGWINALDGNAVGSAGSTLTLAEGAPNTVAPAYAGGKYYSAADTLDLTFNTAPLDVAVARVWAVVADCS